MNSVAEKIAFHGISTNDYIHPHEQDFLLDLDHAPLAAQAMDRLSDLSLTLCKQIVLGKYVEITPHMMPQLFDVMRDVCRILNFDGLLRLYVTHEYQPSCMQIGSDVMCVLMPDLMLEKADQDMLYYMLGNAVGMYKGGHIRLATVNAILTAIPEALPVRLALQMKQRAADLTSDRAGLLACQNFCAAARCILWDLGMPPGELFHLTDEETLMLAQDYPQELAYVRQGLLSEAASAWKKWNGTVSPGFYRLRELFTWYKKDYAQLINRYQI